MNCILIYGVNISGHHIAYQRHVYRKEIWTIFDGLRVLIIYGKMKYVRRGDIAYYKPGIEHEIKAKTDIFIIEFKIVIAKSLFFSTLDKSFLNKGIIASFLPILCLLKIISIKIVINL